MTDTGWLVATSVEDGANPFTDPTNALDAYTGGGHTTGTVMTKANGTNGHQGHEFFAFSGLAAAVPAGATITQVEVRAWALKDGGGTAQVNLWNGLYDNDQTTVYTASAVTTIGVAATASLITTTFTTNLPTAAQIRDSGFRNRASYVRGTGTGTRTLNVDTMEIRVTYTAAPVAQGESGGITPAGVLTKKVLKVAGGSVTPAGAATKKTSKLLGGTVTPSGVNTKRTSKLLAGAVTATGTMLKTVRKTFAGTIAPAGAFSSTVVEDPAPPPEAVQGPATGGSVGRRLFGGSLFRGNRRRR